MPPEIQQPPPPPPGPRPPTSRLAITALVLALVPCCPMTGMVGALLGLQSLRRIRLAQGRIGGKRIALAAVFAGAGTAVLWAGLGEHMARVQAEAQSAAIIEQIEVAVGPTAEGDAAAVTRSAAAWSETGPGRPRAADRAAFEAAVAERYGKLERVSIVALNMSSGLSAPTAECAITLHFEESGMLLGAARFQGEVRFPVFVPIFRLTGLSIEDPDAGDLSIGVDLASEADGRTPDGDVP